MAKYETCTIHGQYEACENWRGCPKCGQGGAGAMDMVFKLQEEKRELEAENARLREALEKIATLGAHSSDHYVARKAVDIACLTLFPDKSPSGEEG